MLEVKSGVTPTGERAVLYKLSSLDFILLVAYKDHTRAISHYADEASAVVAFNQRTLSEAKT